jgi:MFS family permease
MPETYRRLLSLPSVRVPLLATAVGRLPIAGLSLATLLLVRSETGSFAVAGAVEACIAIATAASLPIQGRLVDRFGQTRILVPVASLNPLALAGLVIAAKAGAAPVVLAVLGAVCGAAVPAVSACMRTLWASLVGDSHLRQSAFALDAVLLETSFIVGPLMTALIVSAASPTAAVLVNGGLTVAGSYLFASSRASRAWRGEVRESGWAGPLESSPVLRLIVVELPVGAAIGAMEVATIAFCTQHDAQALAGALIAVQALASMAGGLWYGSRRHRTTAAERYPGLVFCIAAGFAPLLLMSSIPSAFPLMLLSGFAFAPAGAVVYSLIDELAPSGTATETSTWTSTAIVSGVAAGNAIAGAVVGGGHAQRGFGVALALAAMAGALALTARPSWRLAVESA